MRRHPSTVRLAASLLLATPGCDPAQWLGRQENAEVTTLELVPARVELDLGFTSHDGSIVPVLPEALFVVYGMGKNKEDPVETSRVRVQIGTSHESECGGGDPGSSLRGVERRPETPDITDAVAIENVEGCTPLGGTLAECYLNANRVASFKLRALGQAARDLVVWVASADDPTRCDQATVEINGLIESDAGLSFIEPPPLGPRTAPGFMRCATGRASARSTIPDCGTAATRAAELIAELDGKLDDDVPLVLSLDQALDGGVDLNNVGLVGPEDSCDNGLGEDTVSLLLDDHSRRSQRARLCSNGAAGLYEITGRVSRVFSDEEIVGSVVVEVEAKLASVSLSEMGLGAQDPVALGEVAHAESMRQVEYLLEAWDCEGNPMAELEDVSLESESAVVQRAGPDATSWLVSGPQGTHRIRVGIPGDQCEILVDLPVIEEDEEPLLAELEVADAGAE